MVKRDARSLYEALGVEEGASQAAIKKAYYRLAMQLHPDKNPNDEGANDRFQSLQRVYAMLGDENKRKLYDTTGSLSDTEQLSGHSVDDLYDFYRTIYKKVTEDDIEEVELAYRGSEEEERDLLRLYTKFRGDMQQVFHWQMCSDPQADSHRFTDVIETAISAKTVKRHAAFTTWAELTAAKPRPKAKARKTKKLRDDTALVAQIRDRAAGQMDGLLASLTAKYGGKAGKSTADVPSEKEFEAAAARVAKRAKRK